MHNDKDIDNFRRNVATKYMTSNIESNANHILSWGRGTAKYPKISEVIGKIKEGKCYQ